MAGVYKDNESGRKGRAEREAFDQMFTDASKGQFDLVLFWSPDRFSREGIGQTVHYLRQLEAHHVHFNSYTEEHLSTENELVRSILLSPLAYFRTLRVRADLGAHEGRDGAGQGQGEQIRRKPAQQAGNGVCGSRVGRERRPSRFDIPHASAVGG